MVPCPFPELLRPNDSSLELGTSNSRVLPKVVILNTEAQLLDAVQRYFNVLRNQLSQTPAGLGELPYIEDDNEVLYYQMLYFVPDTTSTTSIMVPRSVILTSSVILLCDEDLELNICSFNVVDYIFYKDVAVIKAEDNLNTLSLLMKQQKMFGPKKKWVLYAPLRTMMEKFAMECRRTC